MELPGSHRSSAIVLDDSDDSEEWNRIQSFDDFVDLDNEDSSESSGSSTFRRQLNMGSRTPIAQVVTMIKPEHLAASPTHKSIEDCIELQATAAAITARLGRDHLAKQQPNIEIKNITDPSLSATSATTLKQTPQSIPDADALRDVDHLLPQWDQKLKRKSDKQDLEAHQSHQRSTSTIKGQKLGFAALANGQYPQENSRTGFCDSSGDESPTIGSGTVTVIRRYECNKCGKAYEDRSSVRKHQKAHPSCDIKPSLTVPTASQLEDDRYPCNKCGKTYSRQDGVAKHQSRYPDCDIESTSIAALVSQSTKARHACNKCGKTYSRQDSVTQHQKKSPNCDSKEQNNPRMPSARTIPIKSDAARNILTASPAALPVLNPKRKRTIDQIPLGTLFRPDQVLSKSNESRYKQAQRAKRQRREEWQLHQSKDHQDEQPDTILFDDPIESTAVNGQVEDHDGQHTEVFGDDEAESSGDCKRRGDINDDSLVAQDFHASSKAVSLSDDAELSAPPLGALGHDNRIAGNTSDINIIALSSPYLGNSDESTSASLEITSTTPPQIGGELSKEQSRPQLPPILPPFGQQLRGEKRAESEESEAFGEVNLKEENQAQHSERIETANLQYINFESNTVKDGESIGPVPRPRAGGKGISAATLAAWEAGDLITEPHVTYDYYICRRTWAISPSEDDSLDATEQRFGPFYTMEEANVVASKKVYPAKTQANGEEAHRGWSYSYKQDETGLQTHSTEVSGVQIETVVYRGKPASLG